MKKTYLPIAAIAFFSTTTMNLQAYAEDTELIIPQSTADMQELLKQDYHTCTYCGAVANVRQVVENNQVPAEDITLFEITHSSADEDVKAKGLLVPPSKRDSSDPNGKWLISVRYDSGAYAIIEQDTQPALKKGDRVEVISGKIERR